MSENKDKTYIYIIGMHRSGTSLVANLLDKVGIYLGESDDLLPPNFDNRYGFYENKDFVEINDSVLKKFDLEWDSTEGPDFDKDIELTKEKEIANKFIKGISSENNIVAFKDPRATLTLPFWEKIIEGDIKVLFVRRNPLEISDSLKKRNSFSRKKSLSIWENYIRQGLRNIKGLDTLFVNYDDILDNPFPNFVRILKFLDMEYDETIL
ncbi:MAG: Glycosyl transferase family 2, partial [candidate division WS6 bacterium 34_10]